MVLITFILLIVALPAFSFESLLLEITKPLVVTSFTCETEDIYQACTRDLCGSPKDFSSTTLQESNFESFMTSESITRLNEVKAKLSAAMIKQVEANNLTIKKIFKDPKSKEFQSDLDELIKKNNVKVLIEDRLSKCLSSYAASGKKTDQEKKFKDMIPVYLERFVQTAMKGYSEETKKNFSTYFEKKVDLNFQGNDISSDEFIRNLDSYLKNPSPQNSSIESFRDFRGRIDPLLPINEFCPIKFSSAGGDVFLPRKEDRSILFISLYSQMNLNAGEGVFYHELSHILSHAFISKNLGNESYKEFLSFRKKIQDLDPTDLGEPKNVVDPHNGDHEFTEENMADILSYKVREKISGPLTECIIFKQSLDRSQYLEVSLEGINGHSPTLVRVLREAIHRNRTIPQSCTEVISKHSNKFNFKKVY